MNLEISIPEIWLVIFSIVSLPNLKKLIKHRYFFWTAIFPLYATISLFWSTNLLRGALTVGLLWLLWFSIWNVVLTLRDADVFYRQKLQTVFLTTAGVFAGVCWLQCLLDVFGASTETSLLCEGCVSTAFGFPHPNGLTLEPQFMGNLLLAPTFLTLSLYFYAKRAKSKPVKIQSEKIAPTDATQTDLHSHYFLSLNGHGPKFYLVLFIFFSATLFLTFSRGAIYAFALAFVARAVAEFIESRRAKSEISRTVAKSKFGYSLLTIPVLILSFIFTLAMQGVFAELGPTDTNFVSATTSSIHQLSLGKIDLRPETATTSEQPLNQSVQSPDSSVLQPSDDQPLTNQSAPTFSGYVEESTNVRADLTNKALDIWNNSPENTIFGTGFGSAGTELYRNFPDEMGTSKEIVQNEYASILLELGIVGYLFLFLTLLPFIKKLSSLELSYLLTLIFFSGLPNAFHVYLFPPLLRTKPAKNQTP